MARAVCKGPRLERRRHDVLGSFGPIRHDGSSIRHPAWFLLGRPRSRDISGTGPCPRVESSCPCRCVVLRPPQGRGGPLVRRPGCGVGRRRRNRCRLRRVARHPRFGERRRLRRARAVLRRARRRRRIRNDRVPRRSRRRRPRRGRGDGGALRHRERRVPRRERQPPAPGRHRRVALLRARRIADRPSRSAGRATRLRPGQPGRRCRPDRVGRARPGDLRRGADHRGSRGAAWRHSPGRVRTTEDRVHRPRLRHRGADLRLRLGPRDGPADRRRPRGCRGRAGSDRHPQQRHQDPRLHHILGGDDRARCRYRLRPVHRHPLPRGTPRRPFAP